MVTSDLVAVAEKLYKAERDKKRSRYSEQDLEDFRASTGDYKSQVQELIQASRTSYLQKKGGGGGQHIEMGRTALSDVKDSGLLQGKAGGGFFKARAPTEEMNAEHREGLAGERNRILDFPLFIYTPYIFHGHVRPSPRAFSRSEFPSTPL